MTETHHFPEAHRQPAKTRNDQNAGELTGEERERAFAAKIEYLSKDPNVVRLMQRLAENNK